VVGVIELLLALWAAQGDLADKAKLLVLYVGILAITRGFTQIIFAFKLRGVGKQLTAA
jgi:uncharacterized membrane protein HdeD (DUF308 family)